MPVDNHKTYRFMLLDQLLRNHHRLYTMDELVSLCNKGLERKGFQTISDRTLRNDLEEITLEPYEARIHKALDGHKMTYRYEDGFYGIKLFDISDEERHRIEDAINVLNRFEGTPQYDWVRFCLQQIVGDEFVDDGRSLISFQNNPDLYGIEHFETLLKAIAKKQPLKVVYHPYPIKSKEDDTVIVRDAETYNLHPYHLKQFNDRWFLIAQAEGMPYIGNYPIDRIESIKSLHKKYIDTDIDFDEYFDNCIGVSVKDNVRPVLLKVDKLRYPYIKSKPLHWSQTEIKEMETEKHVVIRLKVCKNFELTTAILSYGSDIEVLEPVDLRDEIAETAGKMMNIYKQ